ncbi:MAG: fatty acid desaturase [Nevskiaceae bacterium]|nr:MAG: fatty acid desaturase [Nevskiaceae bacterium]TBR71381.1 MAG: fatty acid desaturase [Nevskiaceae bacterium]
MNPAFETNTLSTAEKIQRVRKAANDAGVALRERHPILKHQDAIGVAILAFALAGMAGTAALYYYSLIAWWMALPVAALFASLTHELEHDLIHLMYFRKNPRANAAMMWLVWLARPSTISPFTRRRMHMHHHMYSGTETDLEEQAITNGLPWGIRRLLMTGDQMLSVYLRPFQMRKLVKSYVKAQNPASKAEYLKLVAEQVFGYVPLGYLYYILWHGFIVFHAVDLTATAMGAPVAWPAAVLSAMAVVNFLAVVWLAPNALRMFCLHFVSSNMHYFGDIEARNPVQQCQVLTPWWMLPFQLFCFNFGATHAIHHFVVKEPFYIRQMTARAVYPVMREVGVRFNDIGTFGRANRYRQDLQAESVVAAVA